MCMIHVISWRENTWQQNMEHSSTVKQVESNTATSNSRSNFELETPIADVLEITKYKKLHHNHRTCPKT